MLNLSCCINNVGGAARGLSSCIVAGVVFVGNYCVFPEYHKYILLPLT